MKFLLKVNIPVDAGNAAAKAGKLGAVIQSIIADLKPEAVYFAAESGQRTAFILLEFKMHPKFRRLRSPGSLHSTRASKYIRSWCPTT